MKCETWDHKFFIRETNPSNVRKIFNTLLQESQFTIKGFKGCYFDEGGYTAVWVLAESHAAIHTFPEEQKTVCYISSCNLEKYEAFLKLIRSMTV